MFHLATRTCGSLLALSFALHSEPAEAFAHLWKITQVYSNEDGSVQFVELFTDDEGETDLSRMFLISMPAGRRFDFGQDLVGETTVDKYLLVATEGFAALPSGVEPDYIMPEDFIDIEGGAIEFWSKKVGFYGRATRRDEFSFEELPGGLMSLNRDFGDTTVYSAEALPTNYEGDVGSVPEPDERLLGFASLAALLVLVRRARVASTRGRIQGAF